MHLLSYGRRGLLVELDSLDEALRLSVDLDRRRPIGVTELTPGARTVLVRFDPARTTEAGLRAELTDRADRLGPTEEVIGDGPTAAAVEIPVATYPPASTASTICSAV